MGLLCFFSGIALYQLCFHADDPAGGVSFRVVSSISSFTVIKRKGSEFLSSPSLTNSSICCRFTKDFTVSPKGRKG